MIQLTHRGVVFERDAAWEAASRTFAERHVVLLPQFVENSLLQRILRLVAEGEFLELEHKARSGNVIARELALSVRSPLLRLFHLLLNSPLLFEAIQELVDCRAGCFPSRKDIEDCRVGYFRVGRCFKMMLEHGHFDSWHDDVSEGRQVGISVNLEPSPAAAGGVEIREGPSAAQRAVARFGDAALFRVALGLEHRGLPSTGTVPRCTFSGWFVASDSRKALGMARRNRLGALGAGCRVGDQLHGP